jgi:hypothetical protein
MANRTTHLTHFHILSSFDGGRRRRTKQDALHAVHGVAKCLSAFPSWVEVTASSHRDMLSIRFVQKKTERELSQSLRITGRHDRPKWLEFEGYDVEAKGWRHRG